jgi:O-antigen ligase
VHDQLIEYDYIVPEDLYKKPYSSVAEWMLFFILLYTLLEAIFSHYLDSLVMTRSAWWVKLTPWNLYPTELLFFGILLIPGYLAIILRGRKYGFPATRGLGLVAIILAIGTLHAIRGWAAGDRGFLWMSDYRQLFLIPIFVPIFYRLGAAIRIEKLADRLCWVGLLLAFYSGSIGILVFMRVIDRKSPLAPGLWSEQTLILLYFFVMMKSIIAGKMHYCKLFLFAFGILSPLNKTPMACFVVSHIITLYILVFWIKYQKLAVILNTIKIFLILGVCVVLISPFFLNLGEGEALRWLANRWLKVEESGGDITAGRLYAWQWALEQWKSRPLLGHGLGHRLLVFTAEGDARPLHVHSIALTTLYQTGILGFVICVSVFAIFYIRMKRFLSNCMDCVVLWPVLAMFIFCMTTLVASMAGHSIGIPHVGFVFWICVALLMDAEAQHYMASLYSNDYGEES